MEAEDRFLSSIDRIEKKIDAMADKMDRTL